MTGRRLVAAVAGLVGAVLVAAPAAAHTEADLVGVPAGTTSVITLKPTHGCGESPTVSVRIRAPSPDALAEDVEGWAATNTPDGAGNTVLEWTGGVLPADEDGAFPVEFTAPSTPGVLLTFPAIQRCEDGQELAWIDGDPAGEYPAPRVLVLRPDDEPARTIDEVPLDAPGRDQLVAIIDVDNPNVLPTTIAPAPAPATAAPAAPTTLEVPPPTGAPATTATSAPTASAVMATAPVTTPPTSLLATTTVEADDDDGSSAAGPIIAVVVVAAIAVAAGAWVVVRRRAG